MKRKTALDLIAKQVYEWHVYMVSVRSRPLSDYRRIPGKYRPHGRQHYEHHIEPKLIHNTLSNSEWERYLQGY